MYASVSTLGRSQYPTLPMGASGNGPWVPQYPALARSISHRSAGGQSDSVFLDAGTEGPGPASSPGRYCEDPTLANGNDSDLETDGPAPPLPHTLPRGARTQPGESCAVDIQTRSHTHSERVCYPVAAKCLGFLG